MRPGRRALGSVSTVLLLAGCAIPADLPAEAPSGPTRENWQLTHRVPGSSTLHVVGQRVDAYEESTRVSFGPDVSGAEVLCSVSVSAPGWGGPENKVGEQLPATVQGRPALRNGAGAEGDYLMWQRADGAWLESLCDDDGQTACQDRLAETVTAKPSDLLLPFDVSTLPPGVGVSSIEADLRSGETKVRLESAPARSREAGAELLLSYGSELDRQEGRATVVGGYPASLNETPRSPGLCLLVQGHDVCVETDAGDTGPYPDRSDEIPVLTAVAESLRFPSDVEDRSSWHPAQEVFG